MSRITKYKESLNKFIKERSCLFNEDYLPNATIDAILYNEIKDSNMIIPIIFLTIMNNQNKKNKVTIQGYYAASEMEFIYTLIKIMRHKNRIVRNYDTDMYYKIVNYLILSSNKTLQQNLHILDRYIDRHDSIKISQQCSEIYHEFINYSKILSSIDLKLANRPPKSDLLRWYIKDDKELAIKFKQLKQIDKDSFKIYIDKRYGSLCELLFVTAWSLGCGERKYLKKIRKLSKYFCMIYKLYVDFISLHKDLETDKNISLNYIVNYGLQEAYETYLDNKQKFINDAYILDIYTNTVKEIITYIENEIDEIIDQTSPELKSICSTI